MTLSNQTLSNPIANTLYSRRRHRTQRATLPDWVWGAGLGVLVLIFVGGFFLIRSVTGGGSGGTCDSELSPLGSSQVDAEAFIQEDADLGRVILLLNGGDRSGAEAAFYGPVHNFTHNADPPLREVDKDAAKALCEAVVDLEDSLATNAANATIAAGVQDVRDRLRDAAEILGYPRPGG